MADNEVILDKDVSRLTGVRLVPSLRGPWEVYYEVVFVDGRVQQRPMSACACPIAIASFEGRYFASAHRNGQPGTRMLQPEDDDAKSESIAESRSRDDDSEADDRHFDSIPSDDSVWNGIVDSQGRSATSPTVRAAIRAKAAARDETFSSPSKAVTDTGDSTEHGSSSKSSASSISDEPSSATKSVGTATSDSLLQELAAKGGSVDDDDSPISKRPTRAAACRGIALRRFATRQQLHDLDDCALYGDDDDSDAADITSRKKISELTVKDEVFDEADGRDDGPDPWGNVPAPDPWTVPAPAPAARERFAKMADSWHNYRPMRSYQAEGAHGNDSVAPAMSSSSANRTVTEKQLGVVGSMLGEYFASQARKNGVSSQTKHVKVEKVSDDDNDFPRKVGDLQRKRRRGQRASKTAKIEVVTLSDDEDAVPHIPAKKSKKRENDVVVYVLSSDSDNDHDPSES